MAGARLDGLTNPVQKSRVGVGFSTWFQVSFWVLTSANLGPELGYLRARRFPSAVFF